MKRLLLAAVLVLAGCGSEHSHAAPSAPPPTSLAERCGGTHTKWRTLWLHAADGTRLDGAVTGTGGSGVVFLHESPADLCGWEPYGATLARRGFRVLLVDLRAFGLSGRGRYGGKRGGVADVRGAVHELKRLGAKRVALVGASYGGATALVAAPALGSQIAGVASLSGELALPNAQLNALATVPRLRVPLLVLGSRGDPYLDAADARRLLRAAGPKQKTLVEFDGTSHGWNLLGDASTRTRADRELVAFLRRVAQ